MKVINVNLDKCSYSIFISSKNRFNGLAARLKQANLGTDAFLITNARIFNLYAQDMRKQLKSAGIKAYFYKIKDSEQSKSIEEYVKAIKKLSSLDTQKRIFLIALGGGVIGDLCGFIAATYKRGINYVQIPTTLLGQVDSAIGGKTAIDLPSGKNLVGAFFQPKFVFSCACVLNTLAQRQLRSGLAEVVKYGVIADQDLFCFLEKNSSKILGCDQNSLLQIISACSRIKARVVEVDEKETKGLRTILNFGHTVGHALETAAGYTGFTHGEAISIGMDCAAEIALLLGLLAKSEMDRIKNLLCSFRLPIVAKRLDFKAVISAFYRDKKFIHGKIRLVLPVKIGHVIVTEDVPFDLIKKVIKKHIL